MSPGSKKGKGRYLRIFVEKSGMRSILDDTPQFPESEVEQIRKTDSFRKKNIFDAKKNLGMKTWKREALVRS